MLVGLAQRNPTEEEALIHNLLKIDWQKSGNGAGLFIVVAMTKFVREGPRGNGTYLSHSKQLFVCIFAC
jgi:hypothetical protein